MQCRLIYKKILVLQFVAGLLLCASQAMADVLRKQVILIDGDGAGYLSLIANYSSDFDDLVKSENFALDAIELNDLLVLKSKNNSDSIIKYIHKLSGSPINVKRTPALIHLDAKKVNYNSIFLWGNQILLDVTYTAFGRKIAWRSDYFCEETVGCKLLIEPQDQLFELSYVMLRNEAKPSWKLFKERQGNSHLKNTDSQIIWPFPEKTPHYYKNEKKSYKNSIEWNIVLDDLNVTLVRKKQVWQVSGGDKQDISDAMVKFLNSFQDKSMLSIGEREFVTPIDAGEYSYYQYVLDGNKQVGKRLVYVEQLNNYINQWNRMKLLGYLKLGGRGFIYFKPYTAGISGVENLAQVPVAVFEFVESNGLFSVVPGIKSDLYATLLSNEFLMESIRRNKKYSRVAEH